VLKVGVPEAPKILQRNVYGWFVRLERGVYALTDAGTTALMRWEAHVPPTPAAAEAVASSLSPLP
jgi:hypothetical protein